MSYFTELSFTDWGFSGGVTLDAPLEKRILAACDAKSCGFTGEKSVQALD